MASALLWCLEGVKVGDCIKKEVQYRGMLQLYPRDSGTMNDSWIYFTAHAQGNTSPILLEWVGEQRELLRRGLEMITRDLLEVNLLNSDTELLI